mmetsp:Transcript_52038/g.151195  ORF Transcript_52038/g.151195 Transcript_52038/m.151195 type:complete len:94 (+) Transcript_52038:736-1017(+)
MPDDTHLDGEFRLELFSCFIRSSPVMAAPLLITVADGDASASGDRHTAPLLLMDEPGSGDLTDEADGVGGKLPSSDSADGVVGRLTRLFLEEL